MLLSRQAPHAVQILARIGQSARHAHTQTDRHTHTQTDRQTEGAAQKYDESVRGAVCGKLNSLLDTDRAFAYLDPELTQSFSGSVSSCRE